MTRPARIVYLHGFASSPLSKKARYFGQLLPSLEVPDLAAGDFEHLTISGQLRVVEETCRGERVSLIGSSMGGYLAALYAARHPEVERLVLMAPAFCFLHRWAESWEGKAFLPIYHYGEGRTCNLSRNLIDDGREYEDYPDFHQPALIFHGIHDDTVPAEYSKTFAAAHSNATLRLLDSDHELIDVLNVMGEEALRFLNN